MKEMLYAVRCLKSNEDMILALAGQFKQLSDEPCYEFECFKWRVVCSPVRTQGCRKQQQGHLFHTNAIIPHKSSQQHTLGF